MCYFRTPTRNLNVSALFGVRMVFAVHVPAVYARDSFSFEKASIQD